jgi:aspartate/methionine/tyrosine aminotransferase
MAPTRTCPDMSPLLAPRGATIAPFYAGEIGLRAMARLRAGLPVIPMHFGQPSAGIPTHARAAAHASLDRDSSGYWLSAATARSTCTPTSAT